MKKLTFYFFLSEKLFMRLYLLNLSTIFLLSCGVKIEYKEEDHAVAYASSLGIEGRNLMCSPFSDDTFRGKMTLVEDKEDCFHVRISKHPSNLFSTENIFLQVYPFSIREGATKYGKSLSMVIYQYGDESDPLIQSQIIDSFLIDEQIGTSSKNFFRGYYFELCNIKQESWDGVQLVTYLRGDGDQSSPIRVTKFLLPPFLANPTHFKRERENALLVYHPFFKLKNGLKIEPSSYYEISKSVCSSDLK